MLAFHIIWLSEFTLSECKTFTDSLQYTYLKENKSYIGFTGKKKRNKDCLFFQLANPALLNALRVIAEFNTIDGLLHKCCILGKFMGSVL